jgi:hypothetical protein
MAEFTCPPRKVVRDDVNAKSIFRDVGGCSRAKGNVQLPKIDKSLNRNDNL